MADNGLLEAFRTTLARAITANMEVAEDVFGPATSLLARVPDKVKDKGQQVDNIKDKALGNGYGKDADNLKGKDVASDADARGAPRENDNGPSPRDDGPSTDWFCKDCEWINFAGHNACVNCNASYNTQAVSRDTASVPSVEWVCDECKVKNFPHTKTCRKCLTPKLGDATPDLSALSVDTSGIGGKRTPTGVAGQKSDKTEKSLARGVAARVIETSRRSRSASTSSASAAPTIEIKTQSQSTSRTSTMSAAPSTAAGPSSAADQIPTGLPPHIAEAWRTVMYLKQPGLEVAVRQPSEPTQDVAVINRSKSTYSSSRAAPKVSAPKTTIAMTSRPRKEKETASDRPVDDATEAPTSRPTTKRTCGTILPLRNASQTAESNASETDRRKDALKGVSLPTSLPLRSSYQPQTPTRKGSTVQYRPPTPGPRDPVSRRETPESDLSTTTSGSSVGFPGGEDEKVAGEPSTASTANAVVAPPSTAPTASKTPDGVLQRLARLEQALAQRESRFDKFDTNLSDIADKLKDSGTFVNIKNLLAEKDEVIESNLALIERKDQTIETLKNRVSELKTKLKDLDREKDSLEDRFNATERELEEAHEELEEAEARLDEEEETRVDLEAFHEEMIGLREEVIERLEDELAMKDMILERQTRQVNELTREVDDHSGALTAAETTHKKLRGKLRDKKNDLTATKSDLKRIKLALMKTNVQLQRLKWEKGQAIKSQKTATRKMRKYAKIAKQSQKANLYELERRQKLDKVERLLQSIKNGDDSTRELLDESIRTLDKDQDDAAELTGDDCGQPTKDNHLVIKEGKRRTKIKKRLNKRPAFENSERGNGKDDLSAHRPVGNSQSANHQREQLPSASAVEENAVSLDDLDGSDDLNDSDIMSDSDEDSDDMDSWDDMDNSDDMDSSDEDRKAYFRLKDTDRGILDFSDNPGLVLELGDNHHWVLPPLSNDDDPQGLTHRSSPVSSGVGSDDDKEDDSAAAWSDDDEAGSGCTKYCTASSHYSSDDESDVSLHRSLTEWENMTSTDDEAEGSSADIEGSDAAPTEIEDSDPPTDVESSESASIKGEGRTPRRQCPCPICTSDRTFPPSPSYSSDEEFDAPATQVASQVVNNNGKRPAAVLSTTPAGSPKLKRRITTPVPIKRRIQSPSPGS